MYRSCVRTRILIVGQLEVPRASLALFVNCNMYVFMGGGNATSLQLEKDTRTIPDNA